MAQVVYDGVFAHFVCLHAAAVSLFALADVREPHRVGDHLDAGESAPDQRLGRFVPGAAVVQHDAADFQIGHLAVEQHERDVLAGDVADDLVRAFARNHDQAVDALVAEDLDQILQLLRILVGAAEQHGVLMFICVVFDAPGDVGEELVRNVRNDDADGVRLAAAQGAGGVVGLVIEFLRDLQNALGRFLVHAVGLLAVGLVVHHERDQGDRNSRLRGYIFYGDSLRAHIFCDFLQYLGFSVTFANVIKTF